ncbi:MAG: hypothetical protein ACR2J8_12790, partial [Thermomicrobiales bacterium]
MDHRSFDRIARLLGAATSRRATLRSVIAAALGGGAVSGAEAKTSHPYRHDRPDAQGPCGKGKKSRCRKHSDCCTRYCDKPNGRLGRCRCIKANNPCTEKQTCCKGLACSGGTCRSKRPPRPTTIDTGDPCVAGDVCTDAQATCTTYALGLIPGTFCLGSAAANCGNDDDCASSFCNSGTCAATCTVCASGCEQTTIAGAVAAASTGSVIGIAPGTYDEKVTPTTEITLRRCGSAGIVDWNDTSDSYSLVLFGINDTVTVEDIVFNGTGASGIGAFIILASSNPSYLPTLIANNCTFRDCAGSSSNAVRVLGSTTAIFTGCDFTNNLPSANDGAAAYVHTSSLTAINCTFTNNVVAAPYYGGAINAVDSTITLKDSTFTGNIADSGGALHIGGTILDATGCTFSTNGATAQGGVGLQGGAIAVTLAGTITLTDCT